MKNYNKNKIFCVSIYIYIALIFNGCAVNFFKEGIHYDQPSLYKNKTDKVAVITKYFVNSGVYNLAPGGRESLKNSVANAIKSSGLYNSVEFGMENISNRVDYRSIDKYNIEILLNNNASYNWYVAWPAIYPMPLYWPVQPYKGTVSVEMDVELIRGNKKVNRKILKDGFHQTNLYGFFRKGEAEKKMQSICYDSLNELRNFVVENASGGVVADSGRGSKNIKVDSAQYNLKVVTNPPDATVKIMNISPKYDENLDLSPGMYDLKVDFPGYETFRQWVEIKNSDELINVNLSKINEPELLTTDTPLVTNSTVSEKEVKKTALVIGNDRYVYSPLSNPSKDAAAIADILRELGFDVILRSNLNQVSMDRAINEFRIKLNRNGGVGLFYYAGHGIQVDGENYLIPIDSKILSETDVKYKAFPLGQVLGYMDEADTELNILIMDACRNNPVETKFRSTSRGLARVRMPESKLGYIVCYSTEAGQVALDGEGENSPFALNLMNALKKPGTNLSSVFRQTRIGVYNETNFQQRPMVLDGTLGDFYFRAKGE
ncbi:MAG: caspase family protein [Desulfobacteraceae bacterium]|nr:caspase family protein [Desulfobacteraceae bacterium]MCB9494695.1 caspase family protein [Desulfobacteraceae bacterium]